MIGFSAKVTINGSFATGSELEQAFAESAGSYWGAAGFSLQQQLIKQSPYKSGALSNSWAVGQPFWSGHRFVIQVGTNIRYARAANVRSSKAGYIEDSIEAAREIVLQNLEAGIRAVQLWRPK